MLILISGAAVILAAVVFAIWAHGTAWLVMRLVRFILDERT